MFCRLQSQDGGFISTFSNTYGKLGHIPDHALFAGRPSVFGRNNFHLDP